MTTSTQFNPPSKENEAAYAKILTPEAIEFLNLLHKKFDARRLDLLNSRDQLQKEFDTGKFPEFPKETEDIRNGDWVAAPIPQDLQDRRVEITGPVDRKMIINALNCGASTFMADFEDSNSPTLDNNLQGQINLKDAIAKTITLEDKGKTYQLNPQTAVLMVRPRGIHLNEKHFLVDNKEISGSLFDFGLYFFHNAQPLLSQNSGPYFYIPKLEHYKEARWWNDVFVFAQDHLNIPQGSIKATILIETITASFQLDEIIYELKDHIAGLNCGRWDYIFSYIKKFRKHKNFSIPDREQITMTSPFMNAYSLRVIQRCHKRNIHAMGGMAAQIPVKNDDQANEIAFNKVRGDKEREVKNGHDGTWVAHPALVEVAKDVFDQYMPSPNQINNKRADVKATEADLVELPLGNVTEKGLRGNINIGILYLESWLAGRGAAALYNLMEDAATAEISRTQVWFWLHSATKLEDGRLINTALYEQFRTEEIEKIKELVGAEYFKEGNFKRAIELFDDLILDQEYKEFLTLDAYRALN